MKRAFGLEYPDTGRTYENYTSLIRWADGRRALFQHSIDITTICGRRSARGNTFRVRNIFASYLTAMPLRRMTARMI